jgi:hypothetical protein
MPQRGEKIPCWVIWVAACCLLLVRGASAQQLCSTDVLCSPNCCNGQGCTDLLITECFSGNCDGLLNTCYCNGFCLNGDLCRNGNGDCQSNNCVGGVCEAAPTATPTSTPTATPTNTPTVTPTSTPTVTPTARLGPAPVPTLSGSPLLALGALLALVGLLGLSRIGSFTRRG